MTRVISVSAKVKAHFLPLIGEVRRGVFPLGQNLRGKEVWMYGSIVFFPLLWRGIKGEGTSEFIIKNPLLNFCSSQSLHSVSFFAFSKKLHFSRLFTRTALRSLLLTSALQKSALLEFLLLKNNIFRNEILFSPRREIKNLLQFFHTSIPPALYTSFYVLNIVNTFSIPLLIRFLTVSYSVVSDEISISRFFI